jgi:hypothetical protein
VGGDHSDLGIEVMPDFVKEHFRYGEVSPELEPWPSLLSEDVIDDKADTGRLSETGGAIAPESFLRTGLPACSSTHLHAYGLGRFG